MEQLQESSQKEVARAEQLEQERCQGEQQTKRLQQVIETVRENSDRQQAELQVRSHCHHHTAPHCHHTVTLSPTILSHSH